MKRFLLTAISSLAVLLALSPIASANLNNFEIIDFDAELHLSRDQDDRSVLKITETIVAEFPPNQNRGLERSIPKEFNDHPTNLKIKSVTDATGKDWQYSTYDSGDSLVVRIGDPDIYVSGRQVYKISYDQTDVTRHFEDTSDEFYWDINGVGWRAPIRSLSASLTIDQELAGFLNDNMACYQGVAGSTERCTIERSGNTLTTKMIGLEPGENMTFAIGFQSGTFAEYERSIFDKVFEAWIILQAVLVVVGIIVLIWLAIRYFDMSSRISEQRPIAPEYLPPKDASVQLSAHILGLYEYFAAQLIDLAVRRYINIYEVKSKTAFRRAEYEVEITKSLDDLKPEERELLDDVFMGKTSIGNRMNLKKLNSFKMQSRLGDNPAKLRELVYGEYNMRHKVPEKSNSISKPSRIMLILAIPTLSPVLLAVGLIGMAMSKSLWVLTDKGLSLVRYLKGLKMYIKTAEEDRIKMLQSPEGAEKVGDVGSDAKLVKLYERTLPYAILFKSETEWSRRLGAYYETTGEQPEWLTSPSGSAFSAVAFSSLLNSFSTAVSSSSSSSSTGGSTGGGYSGGGGGGGGGGGW